jgi:uncharacterized ferredoxin-like protein
MIRGAGEGLMPVFTDVEVEREAIVDIAHLMAISARTAPKARGVDNLLTVVVTGKEKDELAEAMERKMKLKRNPLAAFTRDADAVRKSPVVLLLGVKGTSPKQPENPLNCGACGHETCAAFIKTEKRRGEDFTGPICVFEAIDLGIAIGSAVKTASDLNADNRLMYTLGAAAKDLQLLDADVVIGIPLSATGKNIYFDRQ